MPLAYNIIVNTGSLFSDSWKYINGILHPLLTIFCVIFFYGKGEAFFLVKLRGRRPPLFTRAPGLKVLPQGESIIQRYFSLLLTTLTYHSSPTFTWLFIQISFFFPKNYTTIDLKCGLYTYTAVNCQRECAFVYLIRIFLESHQTTIKKSNNKKKKIKEQRVMAK